MNCRLFPGQIDANTEYVFQNGQCHALAIALGEKLDCPIAIIKTVFDGMVTDELHMVVEIGPDQYLDISGIYTEDELLLRYNYRDLGKPVLDRGHNPDYIRAYVKNISSGWEKPEIKSAALFVDALLARYPVALKPSSV